MSLEFDGAVRGKQLYVNGTGGPPRLTGENFGNVGIGDVDLNELLEISKSVNTRL